MVSPAPINNADKLFNSPEEAQKEAERIKKEKGESEPPRRCT